jgi:formate dehydrogenase gamma subunit
MANIDRIKGNKIRRFSIFRIIEHWAVMLTFGVLVVTGLSQKFYSLDVSQWLIFKMGGIDYARLVHRFTGIVFLLITSIHIIIGIIGVAFKKWHPSMIISKKDFTDAIHNIKYYLGIESRPAICDRYNYKQKFEYWGILIGGLLMIVTGIILWFPTFITRFLPGEIIPAAKVMHTNQALVIFLIIAVWHIYNSIFSPDVSPLDTSIFTGYISKERMLTEHPIELARLEGKPLEEIITEHQDIHYENLETS